MIDGQIVFSDLNGSSEAVWSLLIASGYLKINEVQIKKDGLRRALSHILSITNYEAELMFGKMIHSWFKKAENNYPEFIRCMLTGNVKDMNNYMTRIARDTFSSFDTGTHPSEKEPERFLCRSLQKYDIIHSIQRLCPDNPVSSHARLALLAKIKEYGDL
ncbi:MAG: hypothetical protein IJT16_04090 [Lachnospiraceae bacterium]|nr:hypothetical protein [Lachnospiraceae bacterium]